MKAWLVSDAEEVREMYMVQMKILPKFFQAVVDGDKTFEIRKDDREIRVGDLLLLKEWENDSYTGRGVIRRVCYILRNAEEYGLMKGYVLLGIEPAGLQFRGCTKEGEPIIRRRRGAE